MNAIAFFSWPDLVLLLVLGLFAFLGWRRGFVRMCFRLFSFLGSLLLARLFSPMVGDALKTTTYYQQIVEQLTPDTAMMPVSFSRAALLGGLQTQTEQIGTYLADQIVGILAFLLVFLAARLLLFFLERILSGIVSLPLLNLTNHTIGLVLGTLEGFLILCVLLAGVAVFAPLQGDGALNQAIEQSGPARVLYLNNPLLSLVENPIPMVK